MTQRLPVDTVLLPVQPDPVVYFERFGGLLSAAETSRFQRFRHDGAASLFIAGRALVRTELAKRTGCSPDELQLACSQKGRPLATAPAAATGWSFSISHTPGWAGIAIARHPDSAADTPVDGGALLGFDLQKTTPNNDLPAVAKRVYSTTELRDLAAIGEVLTAPWLRRFFTLWTAKEAWIKARGAGFSLPPKLATFAMSPPQTNSDMPAVAMSSCDPEARENPADWTFSCWSAAPAICAAVATNYPHWLTVSRLPCALSAPR